MRVRRATRAVKTTSQCCLVSRRDLPKRARRWRCGGCTLGHSPSLLLLRRVLFGLLMAASCHSGRLPVRPVRGPPCHRAIGGPLLCPLACLLGGGSLSCPLAGWPLGCFLATSARNWSFGVKKIPSSPTATREAGTCLASHSLHCTAAVTRQRPALV